MSSKSSQRHYALNILINFIRYNFIRSEFFYRNFNKKSKFYKISTLKNFNQSLFNIIFWSKIRTSYFTNNWVYTTNHKRIAVNYFWFVILSGIVGMVLATLIRLEFAYPGVGIFAGDSLQYLSMATAHGVIMVFFMIMPLLFGAFANFLIPTHLGVHDVAFPRLNSAAFWFLPGGLLMLCQLVCVDRRYQRMNCFNIREVQSILKKRFYTDLINTHDYHTFLDKTAMGLRFKTNNINNINSNIFVFYNYGLEFTPKIRTNSYFFNNKISYQSTISFDPNSFFFYFLNNFNNYNPFFYFLNNLYLFLIKKTFYITFLNLKFSNIFLIIYTFFIITVEDFIELISKNLFIDNFIDSFIFMDDWSSVFFNDNYNLSVYDIFRYLSIFFLGNNFILYNNFIEKNFTFDFFYFMTIPFFLKFFDFYYFINSIKFYFNFRNFNQILFEDFFFYIKFFEILYFYKNNNNINKTNFYFYINYIYSIQNLLSFYNNFYLFFFKQNKKQNNFYTNIFFYSSKENNLTIDSFNNSKIINSRVKYFNFFKLNYDSFFIYFYSLFYSLYVLPFLILNIIKNIFNVFDFFNLLQFYYNFIISWFLSSLLNDNIFYFIYKILTNSSNNLKNYHDFNIFFFYLTNFFSKIYFFYYTEFNFFKFFQDKVILVHLIFSNFFSPLSYLLTLLIKTFNLILFSNKTNFFFSFFYDFIFFKNTFLTIEGYKKSTDSYYSDFFNNTSVSFLNKYTNEENSNIFRYVRFYNPVFKYDFKSGDYFPKFPKETYFYLFNTISQSAGSLKTSAWYFSPKYIETFNKVFDNYFEKIDILFKFDNFNLRTTDNNRFIPTDAFYNFFYLLSKEESYFNKKWISLNSLNQKFYRMFNTSSMQERIYSNWRQLKFTREAWRCKLLAARHQKTLFRRYFHEDGVFWSIERNAKDLLPGWAMITPFSARTRFTAVGKTDIGLMGVFLVLNSSIISGANFLVTYRYLSTLNNRKMRDARVFFTESVIVACWMMIFANPMLAIAILMLLSDRHWQTSFFDYSGGGDTVLFQHMFWFFGHPEVYVIIIPTFGFTNSMISYYLRKRVSARASLMYSMYTIAFLGFFVWGHHMYMVGLAHTTRMLFSTLTVMISVPAATKIMHWCVTTVNSAIAMELPLLFTFTFIFLFVSGGISGMCVAHTGMDVLFHDTFYVIGHFHVMLAGGAMFGSFGAFYFYFPAIFGVKYSRIYAYLHYSYYLLGQLLTVIPMFWLGYAGMPRRVLDYPASMGGWHSVISAGHMLSVAGLIAFFIMIFDSLRQGKAVIRNTFGISRYNTRLNFYLYEISRLNYIQQKGYTLFRSIKPGSIKLNEFDYSNFEPLETTIINYTFAKK